MDREREYRERNEEYRRRSTSGSSAKRNPDRKIRMTMRDYKKSLAAISIATAIAVTGIFAGGTHLVDKAQDSMYLGGLINDFQAEFIAPETHRTNDNEHYFYDYSDVARKMEDKIEQNADTKEEKEIMMDTYVYILLTSKGAYQTDKFLDYTEYKGLDNFLKEHNIKDSDEAKKKLEDLVLAERSKATESEGVRNMLQELNVESDQNTASYGGSK